VTFLCLIAAMTGWGKMIVLISQMRNPRLCVGVWNGASLQHHAQLLGLTSWASKRALLSL
jgi:hypothetical protein